MPRGTAGWPRPVSGWCRFTNADVRDNAEGAVRAIGLVVAELRASSGGVRDEGLLPTPNPSRLREGD